MPAKDKFHAQLIAALLEQGWVITNDPLSIKLTRQSIHIDLGAEKHITAEKDGRKIAVEIKSFTQPSSFEAIQRALGQYLFYRYFLQRNEPNRVLWLALPEDVLEFFEQEPGIREMLGHYGVYILIYNAEEETIIEWIEPNTTEL